MNELLTQAWYQSLVDDCSAIVTEAVHNSRWELIIGHHALGRRIVTDPDYQRNSNGNGKVLQALAEDIGQSERTIYYSIKCFEKYPDPQKIPGGKNISWTKVTKLLTDGEEKRYEARSFIQRMTSFENSLSSLLDKYPGNRDDIIKAILRVIGGEWR